MIFGTDGIRGKMGVAPLDETTIRKLGHVLGQWLGYDAAIVIGSDTRASCSAIATWLTHQLGVRTIDDLGVVPTPVVAYETKARGARLGIMITASHNPAGDNGIKFFDDQGLKIPYKLAQAWSAAVAAAPEPPPAQAPLTRAAEPVHYQNLVLEHFSAADFQGMRLGFDLANGAAFQLVPALCRALEIDAVFLADQPDGSNINQNVGAMHPQKLSSYVSQQRLDLGFAFDGDGDRLVLVAPDQIHGDIALYLLHRILREEGTRVSAVVGTIMCGLGLERCLETEGLELLRTPVGDQNVLAEMVASDLPLGGEPSGHLIQGDLFPAGDGFLAALRLARGLRRNPDLLSAARAAVPIYPYFEKAVPVARKPPIDSLPELQTAIDTLQAEVSAHGRLIVRYSGTEPKLRLYLEAPDLTPYRPALATIEDLIARRLT